MRRLEVSNVLRFREGESVLEQGEEPEVKDRLEYQESQPCEEHQIFRLQINPKNEGIRAREKTPWSGVGRPLVLLSCPRVLKGVTVPVPSRVVRDRRGEGLPY